MNVLVDIGASRLYFKDISLDKYQVNHCLQRFLEDNGGEYIGKEVNPTAIPKHTDTPEPGWDSLAAMVRYAPEEETCYVRPCTYDNNNKIWWIWNPSAAVMVESWNFIFKETPSSEDHIEIGMMESATSPGIIFNANALVDSAGACALVRFCVAVARFLAQSRVK